MGRVRSAGKVGAAKTDAHTFMAKVRRGLQRLPFDKQGGKDADNINWYRGAEEIRITASRWTREDAAARFADGIFKSECEAVLKQAMGKDWYEQYESLRSDPQAWWCNRGRGDASLAPVPPRDWFMTRNGCGTEVVPDDLYKDVGCDICLHREVSKMCFASKILGRWQPVANMRSSHAHRCRAILSGRYKYDLQEKKTGAPNNWAQVTLRDKTDCEVTMLISTLR